MIPSVVCLRCSALVGFCACEPAPRGRLSSFADHLWFEGYKEMGDLLRFLIAECDGVERPEIGAVRWAIDAIERADTRDDYAGQLHDMGALAAIGEAFGGRA